MPRARPEALGEGSLHGAGGLYDIRACRTTPARGCAPVRRMRLRVLMSSPGPCARLCPGLMLTFAPPSPGDAGNSLGSRSPSLSAISAANSFFFNCSLAALRCTPERCGSGNGRGPVKFRSFYFRMCDGKRQQKLPAVACRKNAVARKRSRIARSAPDRALRINRSRSTVRRPRAFPAIGVAARETNPRGGGRTGPRLRQTSPRRRGMMRHEMRGWVRRGPAKTAFRCSPFARPDRSGSYVERERQAPPMSVKATTSGVEAGRPCTPDRDHMNSRACGEARDRDRNGAVHGKEGAAGSNRHYSNRNGDRSHSSRSADPARRSESSPHQARLRRRWPRSARFHPR